MATHHHGHHHEDMLSVEEARDKILSQFGVLNAQNFLITEALGLVTSDQVRSEINIPPLDNSAMDGYAVMSTDVSTATYEHPVMLEILETIPAGSLPTKRLKTGAASRIMTGAPVPEHCDAVIPFEDTTEKDFSKSGRLTEIGIRTSVSPGTNVRVKGKDIKEADSVLEEGHVITAATIGVLASMGMSHVRAIRKPVVSILSTGNELLSPGEKPAEGKIFDSNSSSIMASVIQLGAIPRYIGIARDEMGSVREKLREAMESDLVIS